MTITHSKHKITINKYNGGEKLPPKGGTNIKLILAGFPCTQFSIAQKNKRINKIDFTADEFVDFRNSYKEWWLHIDEFEKITGEKLGIEDYEFALGLQLFFNCIIAVDRTMKESGEQVYYLFENVSSMQKEIKIVMEEILHKMFGGTMTEINSALVSAQNRKRIYFTNFGDIEQPEDKSILLRDILDSGIVWNEKAYCLTTRCSGAIPEDTLKKKRHSMVAEPLGAKVLNINPSGKGMNGDVMHINCKSRCLTTNKGEGMKIIEPIRIGSIGSNSQAHRVYSSCGKSVNLVANGGGQGAKTGLYAVPVKVGEINGGGQGNRIYNVDGKSTTITAQGGGVGSNTGLYAEPIDLKEMTPYVEGRLPKFCDKYGYLPERFNAYNAKEITDKSPCLTTCSDREGNSGQVISVLRVCTSDTIYITTRTQTNKDNQEYEEYILITPDEQSKVIYLVENGQITIKNKQYPIKLQDGYYIIRKLTVSECRRLQTVPDWYVMPCSNSQNYKMLGNGWTIEVIKHILFHIPNIEKSEIEVLSLYDGMSCGMISLKELGCNVKSYIAYEIDKWAIQTTQTNFPEIAQKGDAFEVREAEWTFE